MKSDSVYSPACFSFHTHSAQHVTFCCKLIIPAVIYLQCVHSWIRQIIIINLTNSGRVPVWMCDGPAWTSSKLLPLVCSDKCQLHPEEHYATQTLIHKLGFLVSVKNKINHHLFCTYDMEYTIGCIDTRLYKSLMKHFLPWNISHD